ncbi:MAG TPA: cadherin-like domain-containing protein, partial [Verrucomicrobiota bacterium]|nr:cadherin-like domain-containing protein [Verrucomicrobiota bacterium]
NPNLPIVTITACPSIAKEGSTTEKGLFIVTRAGNTDSDLVVQYTLCGTARNGTDCAWLTGSGYSVYGGSLTMKAGVTQITMPVIGKVDAAFENPETITVVFKTNAAYNVGYPMSATVTLYDAQSTVPSPNAAPSAASQTVELNEDTAVDIQLLGSDPEGKGLSFALVEGPAHGVLSGMPPRLVFTPAADFCGTDHFSFKVNDGEMDSASATVSLHVHPVNDAPLAYDSVWTTEEDTPVQVTLAYSDAEGDSLLCRIVDAPKNGRLEGSIPNLIYIPNPNFFGMDTFSFEVYDGQATPVVATVQVSVQSVNDAPRALNQQLQIQENTSLAVRLQASDPDQDPLHFFLVSAPANGHLTAEGTEWVYTPKPGFIGADQFAFKASDGQADSAVATVQITVERCLTGAGALLLFEGNTEDSTGNHPAAALLGGAFVEANALRIRQAGDGARMSLTMPNVCIPGKTKAIRLEARLYLNGYVGYGVGTYPLLRLQRAWNAQLLFRQDKWSTSASCLGGASTSIASASLLKTGLSLHEWHHLVIELNQEGYMLFVDGAIIATVASQDLRLWPETGTVSLEMGNFDGWIDDVLVRNLTD